MNYRGSQGSWTDSTWEVTPEIIIDIIKFFLPQLTSLCQRPILGRALGMSVTDKNWFRDVIRADFVISMLSTADNAMKDKANAWEQTASGQYDGLVPKAPCELTMLSHQDRRKSQRRIRKNSSRSWGCRGTCCFHSNQCRGPITPLFAPRERQMIWAKI